MHADEALHVPTDFHQVLLLPDNSTDSPIGGRLSEDSCSFIHAYLSWLKLNAGHPSLEDFRPAVLKGEHAFDLFLIPVFIACTDADDLGFAIVHEDDIDYGFHAYLFWFVSSYIYNVTHSLSLLKLISKMLKQKKLSAYSRKS